MEENEGLTVGGVLTYREKEQQQNFGDLKTWLWYVTDFNQSFETKIKFLSQTF